MKVRFLRAAASAAKRIIRKLQASIRDGRENTLDPPVRMGRAGIAAS